MSFSDPADDRFHRHLLEQLDGGTSPTKSDIPLYDFSHPGGGKKNTNDYREDDEPSPNDCSLIRVRGMVQDMLDVEYVEHRQGGTSLSSSSTAAAAASPWTERTPLVLSSIVGTTPWFRRRIAADCQLGSSSHGSEVEIADTGESNYDLPKKKQKVLRFEEQDFGGWACEEGDDTALLGLFYYDQYDASQNGSSTGIPKLRLNDVVEVVGVLEERETEGDGDQNPQQQQQHAADISASLLMLDDDTGLEISSHVRRLHVIWYNRIDLDTFAATRPAAYPSCSQQQHDTSLPNTLSHPEAASILAGALSVSDTVGSALWVTLLSMAERDARGAAIRTPDRRALGCSSLNIVLQDRDTCMAFGSNLRKVLSAVVPQLVSIDLATSSKASAVAPVLLPRKTAGRTLPASPLQLPAGSTVIINVGAESSLLEEQSLHVLQKLTERHSVLFEFEGTQIPFEGDFRIVVVSTSQTMDLLPCSLQVAYQPSTACGGHVNMSDLELSHVSTSDLNLSHVRDALLHARSSRLGVEKKNAGTNVALSRAVLDRAQEDFIDRRARAREGNRRLPNEADFHRWLTLTRLHARARTVGNVKRIAQVEDWELAVATDEALAASFG